MAFTAMNEHVRVKKVETELTPSGDAMVTRLHYYFWWGGVLYQGSVKRTTAGMEMTEAEYNLLVADVNAAAEAVQV